MPCYCDRCRCLSNQDKIIAKFAVQVCGREKSFANADMQKIPLKYGKLVVLQLQTLHCNVAEFAIVEYSVNLWYPALVIAYTTCGCGVKRKFVVPSTGNSLYCDTK